MRTASPVFAHLSGSPALDVLNTVDWRLDATRAIEQLADIDAVLAWARESAFIEAGEESTLRATAAAHPRLARSALLQFRATRECAYGALLDRDDRAIDEFASRQHEAFQAGALRPHDSAWVWHDSELTLRTPEHRLVRALSELMRSDDIGRLRQCADDACGWVYLDTSPRQNRRWCAASDCGDRNRARAYYRRRKAAEQ